MGTNWKSGLIYWSDYTSADAECYSLSHLHPFTRGLELPASGGHSARSVSLHVSFGLHTFTRSRTLLDSVGSSYRDDREVRTFCMERYEHSLDLPAIFHTIERRRCEFARGLGRTINYVVVETSKKSRYAAFFDLRRLRTPRSEAVHLLVQSAYVLDSDKPAPGKGRIHFHAMLGHALRGTTPQCPP